MYDYRLHRCDQEIDYLLNDCSEQIDAGTSKYDALTYEEGIIAAIEWLIGRTSFHPLNV